MHIRYDSRASADRAANRMNVAMGDQSRYIVIDQTAEFVPSKAESAQ